MKKIILSTAALAVMGSMAFADGHAKTIRMGTEGAYAPYNFINDAGDLDGFEIEVGNEMCKRAELKCEWVKNDWDSIIPNLTSGNYDTIIAGMSITSEREEVVDFTQNYIPPAYSSYVALSADADLNGVIAAQTSTLQSGYIAEAGSTLLEFATYDETVAAVMSGEADAVFANKDALAPSVEASGGALVFTGEDVQLGDGVGMALRESDDDLRGKFDAAITSMKEDGSLNTAIKKWFGDDAAVY